MTAAVSWEEGRGDGAARTGRLVTPHGTVRTPAFIPVGTRAAVKTVDSADLEGIGAGIVLANTYHLMLRPGPEVVASHGGLHGFMSWPGPVLTDSGGYQVMSLDPEIEESGVSFRSVYDGSPVTLTPEDAVRIQERLGADVAMVLDVCLPLPAPRELVEAEMWRTVRWGERCLSTHTRADQALFGIVQGGADPELRVAAAEAVAALGFPGFGIGGLSVGEPALERNRALEAAFSALPPDRPRYVMGLGDTEGLLDAIRLGADLFDCVLPTRLARHGKALTREGDFNLKRAQFLDDERPLDPTCSCPACSRYSRAYLRHLIRAREPTGQRLLTLHNLRYTLDLVEEAARAIDEGRLADLAGARLAARDRGSPSPVSGA